MDYRNLITDEFLSTFKRSSFCALSVFSPGISDNELHPLGETLRGLIDGNCELSVEVVTVEQSRPQAAVL